MRRNASCSTPARRTFMQVSKLMSCAGLLGMFACGGDHRAVDEASADVAGPQDSSSVSGGDDASDAPSSPSAQDRPASSVSNPQGTASTAMQPRRTTSAAGANDSPTQARPDGSGTAGAGASASTGLQ